MLYGTKYRILKDIIKTCRRWDLDAREEIECLSCKGFSLLQDDFSEIIESVMDSNEVEEEDER